MSQPRTAPSAIWWKAGNLPAGVRPLEQRHDPPLFDALSATAHGLQDLLSAGTLRSVDLVEEFVWRTEQYNSYLRAVDQYAPNLIQRAKEMDEKRAAGEVLGPLHGIPVLLKNTISTEPSLGMDTNAGALALVGSQAGKNAIVVEKLLAAGAIIFGKTTVSELNFCKGFGIPCGWSAVAGQGQSPYVRGGFDPKDTPGGHSAPGGSSSGLSIAIAAGLGVLGVGEDTESSILGPAVRASLYAMRPTIGIVSSEGVVPASLSFDTPGPMAKDVLDLATLLTIMVDPSKTNVPTGGYESTLDGDWAQVRIGSLDPLIWKHSDSMIRPAPGTMEQTLRLTRAAFDRIEGLAKVFHSYVNLRPTSDFKVNGANSLYDAMDAEYEEAMNTYLGSLSESRVKTMQELVDWNIAHASEALPSEYPSQEMLTIALSTHPTPEELNATRQHYLDVGSSFDQVVTENGIDLIIAPGDSDLSLYATAMGYPIAAIPLSYLDYNGRPIGFKVMATAHNELLLFRFLSAFEASFPPRVPPTVLSEDEESIPKRGGQL